MKTVALLIPPYRDATPRGTTVPPPLGAIALCSLEGEVCLPLLTQFLRAKAPWKPAVVLAEPPLLGAAAAVPETGDVPNQPSWLDTATFHRHGPSAALSAVNTRPQAANPLLASWLAQRLQSPALASVITAVLDAVSAAPPPPSASIRTLRRRCHHDLHCRPSDLIRLARIATLPRLRPGVDALAAEAGTTPTRLRERVGRLLGVSLAQFNEMPGWEWVLEAAVRRGLGTAG